MSPSTNSVRQWLQNLGLESYADTFEANAIDMEVLPDLTDDDLKSIDVLLGHRKKMLKAIKALNVENPAPLTAPAAPVLRPGERRQVTVLFADLSGFTKLSSEIDAEEVHALLNRYFALVDGAITDLGGTVDKHIGDCVMALFGAPVAHTDDPWRAVQAACEIHRIMGPLSKEMERELTAHVGIASGQVVASGTGSDAHQEYTVIGDTVNLAARLQDLAKGGETIIADKVYQAVEGLTDCTSQGEVAVKGLEKPVSVWKLNGLLASPKATVGELVGRSLETGQFQAFLDDCQANRRGHGILLRGELGIGKSRLAAEFLRLAGEANFSTHQALNLDFGVGIGQKAVPSLVASLLKLPSDKDGDRAERLEDALTRLDLPNEKQGFIYDILGLSLPPDLRRLYDAMDAQTREQGRLELHEALLSECANKGPVAIFVDPTSRHQVMHMRVIGQHSSPGM